MKLLKKAALASVCAAIAFNAAATPAKSEKQAKRAVEVRKALFTLVGQNMGPLGAMAKGRMPMNAEVAKTNAVRLEQLSLMIEDYFKTDTTKFDVDTKAKPDIWKNHADFAAKIDDLTKAAQALSVAAASGDEGSIKKAIGGVGKTCGSCHDDYKNK